LCRYSVLNTIKGSLAQILFDLRPRLNIVYDTKIVLIKSGNILKASIYAGKIWVSGPHFMFGWTSRIALYLYELYEEKIDMKYLC
jgi:hypothetical protein